jgi:hypothetical protein
MPSRPAVKRCSLTVIPAKVGSLPQSGVVPSIGQARASGQRHVSARADRSEEISRTSGLSADGESEEGVDRSFKGTDVPLNLGEEKPSFERREQSRGEVVRVDVGGEFPL